jgi:CheY-like chemotaxis protein
LPSAEGHGQRINGNPKRGFIEDGRGMTILLADDEAGIRDLVGRVLRSHGYTVLEAADGAAALEVAEQHAGPIHLLLTDWCMPRLGGEVLIYRLSNRRTAVVVMTGYADIEAPPRVAVLRKPFNLQDLVKTVDGALNIPAGTDCDGGRLRGATSAARVW